MSGWVFRRPHDVRLPRAPSVALLFPPAAGAFTLNCQPASFALTGSDATIISGRVISASPASYALTGNDATVLAGRAINAQPASFVEMASDAGTLADRLINAQAASFVLSGSALSLLAGRFLSADPASYALSGISADLSFTGVGAFVLTADVASYAITGSSATFAAGKLFNAQSASYSLSGVAAGLLVGRSISANPATYAISGIDATFVYQPSIGYVLDLGPGAYSVIGQSTSFIGTRSLNLAPAVYTFSGRDASLASQVAAHTRQQIREAAGAILMGLETTGSRVFQSRLYALQNSDVPALRIYTKQETNENQTLISPALQLRKLVLVVECCAKQSIDIDDVLDSMARQVERKLAQNQTLGGICKYIQLQSTEIGLSKEAEKPIGICALNYEVAYLTNEDEPNKPL